MLGLFMSTAYAQSAAGAPGTTAAPQAPSLFEMGFPLLAIVVFFYFFSIRPQQKRAQDHQKFLSAIKPGDQVVTNSGIIGQVIKFTDKIVTLQIDSDVRIRVIRSQIMGPVAEEGKS